jgi:hypothetical protein
MVARLDFCSVSLAQKVETEISYVVWMNVSYCQSSLRDTKREEHKKKYQVIPGSQDLREQFMESVVTKFSISSSSNSSSNIDAERIVV